MSYVAYTVILTGVGRELQGSDGAGNILRIKGLPAINQRVSLFLLLDGTPKENPLASYPSFSNIRIE